MNLLCTNHKFHPFRIKEDIVETVLLWIRLGSRSRAERWIRLRTRSGAEKLDKKEEYYETTDSE